MRMTYLSLIAGLSMGVALPAQAGPAGHAGHGSRGLHRYSHQFHLQGYHHRERSPTYGNMAKRAREGEREKPNGVVEEQRQEQGTNGAGETQTRLQERTTQPNP